MKCHYEVLDVPMDADTAEIKSAYRKAALKWHPDKNLEDTTAAKEQFQLIKQAYEVLSDRQERAWYDRHREQILRSSNSDFEDNCLDVFKYFTTSCYKGYNDDKNGFYTVFRDVFEKIIQEDLEFFDDKNEFDAIPRFGDSKSNFDEVVGPFYAYWMSYSTKKSYVWLDPHSINDLHNTNRRIMKLVEKENNKVRQKAKKERNEEIRNLVAFVKKRDKRVQAHTKLLQAKVLENRKKQEEIKKLKHLERKKLLSNAEAQVEWAKFDHFQSELESIEKNLAKEFGEQSDSSRESDHLYCEACNKLFKSVKAFANHESSKKHRENIEKLQQTIEPEGSGSIDDCAEYDDLEDLGNLDEGNIHNISEDNDDDLDDKNTLEQNNVILLEDVADENLDVNEESDVEDVDELDQLVVNSRKSKKKNQKSKKNVIKASDDNDDEVNAFNPEMKSVSDTEGDFDFSTSKRNQKKALKKANKKKPESTNDTVPQCEEKIADNNKKRDNKKQKDEKGSGSIILDDVDTDHCCVTCKASFPSKNKLFDHLKKTGHSIYLPQQNEDEGSRSKKKSSKKK